MFFAYFIVLITIGTIRNTRFSLTTLGRFIFQIFKPTPTKTPHLHLSPCDNRIVVLKMCIDSLNPYALIYMKQ